MKPPLATGGRAQKVITTAAQMDAFLERLEPDLLDLLGRLAGERLIEVRDADAA